jgi:drug/metabolite transporter (DMT)-like permease
MRWLRAIGVVVAAAVVFAGSVLILTRIWPGVPSRTDYLVIGTVATFASLIVLFAALAFFVVRIPQLFHKSRRKEPESAP